MKNLRFYLFIMIFAALNYGCAVAQQKYTNGIIKSGDETFLIRTPSASFNTVLIANANNKFRDVGMKSSVNRQIEPEWLDTKIDANKLKNIIKDAIGVSTLKSLAKNPNSKLLLFIDFSPTGRALEVSFAVEATTPLTPEMFKQIEQKIKANITATFNETVLKPFNGPVYKTMNFIRYSTDIFYNKLLIDEHK